MSCIYTEISLVCSYDVFILLLVRVPKPQLQQPPKIPAWKKILFNLQLYNYTRRVMAVRVPLKLVLELYFSLGSYLRTASVYLLIS